MIVTVKYKFKTNIRTIIENSFNEIAKIAGEDVAIIYDKDWVNLISKHDTNSMEYLGKIYDCLFDFLPVEFEIIEFIVKKESTL